MAQNLNIFVRSNQSREEFAREIEILLGVELTVLNEENIFYRYADSGNRWFEIGIHDLSNDFANQLDFESYDYQIEVGAFGIREWEKRKAVVNEYVRFIFDKLKTAGTHDLLLVESVTAKLDEFRATE